MTDLWILLCTINPPNEGELSDGDNLCYMVGPKNEIEKEYQYALASMEFPHIYMGRILESAVAKYERTEYADEVPV